MGRVTTPVQVLPRPFGQVPRQQSRRWPETRSYDLRHLSVRLVELRSTAFGHYSSFAFRVGTSLKDSPQTFLTDRMEEEGLEPAWLHGPSDGEY